MFTNPMPIDATTAPDNYQLVLLDMQPDVELRQAFYSEGLLSFGVPEGKYPNLIANALKSASVFGSTYKCEAIFSKLVRIKNQYRYQLTDDHLKQLLRTAFSTIVPPLINSSKVKANVKLRIELVYTLPEFCCGCYFTMHT